MVRNGTQWVKQAACGDDTAAQIKQELLLGFDHTAAKQFYREGTICYGALRKIYSAETIAFLQETGLIYVDEKMCFTPFNCNVFEGYVVFSDPDIPDDQQDALYIDPLWDTYLSKLLIRTPVKRSLDMGGGSGIISLVLSGFSQEVCYVDVNPRAIEIAKLNAQINGVKNITFWHSNLFEKVPKVPLDYIVFNSPTDQEGSQFVRLLEAGEGVLASFFAQIKSRLTAGGICQVSMGIYDDPEADAYEKIRCWSGLSKSRKLYLIMKSRELNSQKWRRMHLTVVKSDGPENVIAFAYDKLSDDFDPAISSAFIKELLRCVRE